MMTHQTKPNREKDVTDFLVIMDEWPDSWKGMQTDVVIGQGLVAQMRPFIIHLLDKGLTRKTIQRHLNNLWAIGGEIIRDVNYDDSLRQKSAMQLLLNAIESGEAPLIYYMEETEQRSCDATARKLHRFLSM